MKIEDLDNWYRDNHTHDYLHRYNLTEDSLVVDVGSFCGKWVKQMNEMYNCNCIGLEPVGDFYSHSVAQTFRSPEKCLLYNFGLTVECDQEIEMNMDDDGSSVVPVQNSRKRCSVYLKNAKSFFLEINSHIDVLQINIENYEYYLIPYMFENNLFDKVRNIQIQFHDYYEDSHSRMCECIEKIESVGFKTRFNYPLVWYGASRD